MSKIRAVRTEEFIIDLIAEGRELKGVLAKAETSRYAAVVTVGDDTSRRSVALHSEARQEVFETMRCRLSVIRKILDQHGIVEDEKKGVSE